MSTRGQNLDTEIAVIFDAFTQVFGHRVCVAESNDTAEQTTFSSADSSGISDLGEHRWSVNVRQYPVNNKRFDVQCVVEAVNKEAVLRGIESAKLLIDGNFRAQELDEQLACFIQQMSADLEEAIWFRNMAKQVATCRADDPIETLCDRILPQLRELLHARSVMVVKDATDLESEVSVVAIDSESSTSAAAKDLGCQLIRRYYVETEDPIVRNKPFRTGELEEQTGHGISGFVIVRIGQDEKQFGWLVALDRMEPVATGNLSRFNEFEFGTHEATLMECAAVLLATHAGNLRLFAEQEHTLFGVVTAMVNALDARDPYTRGHSHRVALLGERIAQQLDLPDDECEDIYLSGLLHDIGKIGVADQVLLKDGPLDGAERQQIEQHTVIGHSILKPVKQLHHVLPGVLHHHERIDGTGYPGRLANVDIPMAGRILAVADAYDAMTTTRPYRNAMPIHRAESILLEGIGTHWDESVVVAFFQARDDIRAIYASDKHHESNQRESLHHDHQIEDESENAPAALVPSLSEGQ